MCFFVAGMSRFLLYFNKKDAKVYLEMMICN